MKITLAFTDDEAQRLRWLLSNYYNAPRSGLRTLAKQAVRDMASQQAKTMLAAIDAELQAEFAKQEEQTA